MPELANRVSDESVPIVTISVWSALEAASTRSAMASKPSFPRSSNRCSMSRALAHHADLHVADADRRRAVPNVRRLRRLALATVRRAPDGPVLADRVAGAPEARGDPGVRRVLEHRPELAVTD